MNKLKTPAGNSISFLHLKSDSVDAPTIVFVHGFPLDHSMWNQQHPLQSIANLVIPDLPGFGESDSIEDLSMQSLSDQMAMLLDNLSAGDVIFCGLSMGGYIGWEFAYRHRDRLSGLICSNSRATSDDETTARARRVAASQVLKSGSTPVAEAMREKLFSPATIEQNPAVVHSVAETICKTAPETIAAAQLAMAQRKDHSDLLRTLEIPSLVIAGAEDRITPTPEMETMANQISGATFVEIADSGHLSPLENASEFNTAVANWLTERKPQQSSL